MKKLQSYTTKFEANLLYRGTELKKWGIESDAELTIHRIIKYKNRLFEHIFTPNYNYRCIYLMD